MTIWSVLCPSNSATVRRSTPAITSLLAKVWRLQCQLYPSIFASSVPSETSRVIHAEFHFRGVTERRESLRASWLRPEVVSGIKSNRVHLLSANTRYQDFTSDEIRALISKSKERMRSFDKSGKPHKPKS